MNALTPVTTSGHRADLTSAWPVSTQPDPWREYADHVVPPWMAWFSKEDACPHTEERVSSVVDVVPVEVSSVTDPSIHDPGTHSSRDLKSRWGEIHEQKNPRSIWNALTKTMQVQSRSYQNQSISSMFDRFVYM